VDRLGNWARGTAPSCSDGGAKASGMSECRQATNGADTIRQLQSALSRTSQQDKKKRLESL